MRTVVEALERAGREASWGHTFLRADGTERVMPFAQLAEESARVGRGLRALGLRRGDRVALVTPDPEEFVLSFFGALSAGVVPVPLFPPASMTKLDVYGATLSHVLRTAGAKVLVAPQAQRDLLAHLVERACPGLLSVDFSSIPRDAPPPHDDRAPSDDDIALLQFTSGSTSSPKGVAITQGQLAANARAIMIDGLRSNAEDRAVSWLPLYHDMGLIGFVVAPIFTLVATTFIPTTLFIRRPSIWLQTIHRQRGTVTFAPNFAYSLCTRSVQERQMAGWDLSCLRVAGCGAEPISAQVMREFSAKFAPVGFRETAILPAYGMAEATLAVTFAEVNRPLVSERVDSVAIKAGRAEPSALPHESTELVGCGKALRLFEVEVRAERGERLADRLVGEVWVRGPSVAQGYFQNPSATAETFQDGWLRTGDLGYLVSGELFLCGRKKDLIIIHGRNYFPQDIEVVVGSSPGVRDSQAAAFSRAEKGPSGALEEKLYVVTETSRPPPQHPEVKAAIAARVFEAFGLVAHEVVLIRRGTLPKTSSGKVRRSETRARLEEGRLELAGKEADDGVESATG